MEPTVWKFIKRHSLRSQLLLLVLTIVSFPFLYLSLELPKIIINDAIDGTGFPRQFFGVELEQIPYLMVLCVIFLIMVLLNGGLKFANNVYRGTVGERMLRRLRYQLYQHVLRFPLPQFRRMSQGEIVSMITAETEPLGGYIGDSVALPAFQGGTLLTLLAFMFIQDPGARVCRSRALSRADLPDSQAPEEGQCVQGGAHKAGAEALRTHWRGGGRHQGSAHPRHIAVRAGGVLVTGRRDFPYPLPHLSRASSSSSSSTTSSPKSPPSSSSRSEDGW